MCDEDADGLVLDPYLSFSFSLPSVDVCNENADPLVADAEASLGPVFMLVNCAGYSTPAKFEDLTMQQVKVSHNFSLMSESKLMFFL